MNKTIIITGGNGFVGQHLQSELAQHTPDARVVVWDMPHIDITQPETYRAALRELQPTWVVHLAAVAAVGESWRDPTLVERVNVQATEQLLAAITHESPATNVLAVSSADIYGQPVSDEGSYDFTAPLSELPLSSAQPRNPYAQSKLQMERMIEAEYNDRCIRVRPFPHLGPGQRLGFVVADFASQIAAIEAGQQPAILQVGNLEAERDFTDVRDVARAYRLLLDRGTLGDVYHVASGQAISIKALLQQLLALSTATVAVEVDPNRLRPSDTPRLVGDATKLRRATGWQPRYTLAQSLADVLNDWRQRTATLG